MKDTLKVLTVFGTRPEAIKLAPVIRRLEKEPDAFTSVVCVTAQHRRMLDQVLDLFKIKADHDLNIMRPDQSLFDITANALTGLKGVMEKEAPDMVLVQGDTTTTFAASLAAYYLKIPVGHVEAGLRTNEKFHPFPEEMNRRLTTHLAGLHFPPTTRARENLLREVVPQDSITVTGNTVIDALLMVVEGQSEAHEENKWRGYFEGLNVPMDGPRIVLVTGHRRESFGKGFENICSALKDIALRNPGVVIVYPVHLNPNVQTPVKGILGNMDNVHLIEPLDYAPFVYLMRKSYIILTDSGGIQEEAPTLGKPVLVMRNVTERPEAMEAGTSKLVGTDRDNILMETERFLGDRGYYESVRRIHNPYGDGMASGRIIDALKAYAKRGRG
ncbi:MAG: UDP-N-acetylglucosamine 2-epimerase (non-hydrolyzing) [Deltaproteobacteria bacterium]|nr:UDP-N-acetylglucosamine 2-epimerase (non-hydrolyzing) [Deltaproteobacteria bacterium]